MRIVLLSICWLRQGKYASGYFNWSNELPWDEVSSEIDSNDWPTFSSKSVKTESFYSFCNGDTQPYTFYDLLGIFIQMELRVGSKRIIKKLV